MSSETTSNLRRRVDTAYATYRAAAARRRAERAALALATEARTAAHEALTVATTLAETVQRQAHGNIAAIVTRCLAAVFPDPYEFEIIFEQKRNKTEARMVFRRGGHEVDPCDEAGGGVLDVAAFALRLAALALAHPPRRRLLVLDEPFKGVQKALRPRVAEAVVALARDLECQVIMVTHDAEFMVGKVVELEAQ